MQHFTPVSQNHALTVAGSFVDHVSQQREQVGRFLLQSARYLGVSPERIRGDGLAALVRRIPVTRTGRGGAKGAVFSRRQHAEG